MTPERFLKVWAALHVPDDGTFSKRQNSQSGLASTGRACFYRICVPQHTCAVSLFTSKFGTSTAGWYHALKQHHAACFLCSASPEQLAEGALQSSSSTSSINSATSRQKANAAAAAAAAVPVTTRRLFLSEASAVKQKVPHVCVGSACSNKCQI